MVFSRRHHQFCRAFLLWITVSIGWTHLLHADSGMTEFIGKPRTYVLQQLGTPPSTACSANREILIYPQGRIFLSQGIVTEVKGFPSTSSPSSPRFPLHKNGTVNMSPPAVPAVNQAGPPQPSPSQSRPAPALPASPPSFASPVNGLPVRVMGILLLLAIALGILKIRGEKRLARRRAPTGPSGFSPDEAADAQPAGGALPRGTAPLRMKLDARLLDELDWLLFEELTAEYFRAEGFRADLAPMGADGGADIYLCRTGEQRPFAYVQCRGRGSQQEGLKTVRELFGVMMAACINEGYCVGIGEFSAEAHAFAAGKNLQLISGEMLIARFNRLPALERVRILGRITHGDYTTPSCAKCGTKLVQKEMDGRMQWCCPCFPKCRTKPIAVRQR